MSGISIRVFHYPSSLFYHEPDCTVVEYNSWHYEPSDDLERIKHLATHAEKVVSQLWKVDRAYDGLDLVHIVFGHIIPHASDPPLT